MVQKLLLLPGGSNLGEIDDIQYFKKKLFQSLNVPISRLESEGSFSLGRSTEITRDELKVYKVCTKTTKKVYSNIYRYSKITTYS